jgi:predicted acylesterase/phospholipase RssA
MMAATPIRCLLDAAVLLEFYRHSTGADYLPESKALVHEAMRACATITAEFAVGLSRFQDVLAAEPLLASKLRLLTSDHANALLDKLSSEQEDDLSSLLNDIVADAELTSSRALRTRKYIRPIRDEVGYVLRLALLARGEGNQVVILSADRFDIAEALARLQSRPARRNWVGSLESVDVVIAGTVVVFATLPACSAEGVARGYSLVMKGGGMKALGYAGALQELAPFYSFDRFVGTSAGAIAASLLGAGWTASALEEELATLQLRRMVSLNPLKVVGNLLFRGGLFDGTALQNWIELALRRQLALHRTVTFADLPFDVRIPVSTSRRGTVVFGKTTHPEASVAYAARCSSSIPFFFVPANWEDGMAVDGGAQHNLPIRPYVESGGDERVIILSLESASKRSGNRGGLRFPLFGLAGSLSNIWLDQDEDALMRRHSSSLITIDTGTIGAAQLTVTARDREFLVASGRLAAVKFLERDRPALADRRRELEAQVNAMAGAE